jgi:hypothetical protein
MDITRRNMLASIPAATAMASETVPSATSRCSFCGKDQDGVRLIRSPRANAVICEECVEVSKALLSKAAGVNYSDNTLVSVNGGYIDCDGVIKPVSLASDVLSTSPSVSFKTVSGSGTGTVVTVSYAGSGYSELGPAGTVLFGTASCINT